MITAANGLATPTTENHSWNANTIRISTGIERKNSTTIPAGQRSHEWSDRRAIPNRAPTGRAMITLTAAACRVANRPGSRYVVQLSACKNGDHFAAVSWFLDATI